MPPPPLSQSAPDLSEQQPGEPVLRRAISSTELLYERAMARFYQAVEYEESVKVRKHSFSVEQEAARRRSLTGELDVRKLIENERRASMLRKLSSDNSNVASNLLEPKVEKDNEDLPETPRKIEMEIPKNENEFQSEKLSEIVDKPFSENIVETYDQNIEALDENKEDEDKSDEEFFSDDYTESTASEDESFNDKAELMKRLSRIEKSEEMETYHPPRSIEPRMLSPYRHPENDNAVEVLTKPLPLGDPNFVPKPILKKPSTTTEKKNEEVKKIIPDKPERKSLKPSNNETEKASDISNEIEPVLDLGKSVVDSPVVEKIPEKIEEISKSSLPTIQVQEEIRPDNENDNIYTKEEPFVEPVETKEEIIKPKDFLKKKQLEIRQNSIEENKVVVDFYGDIIREVGHKHIKKPKVPIYMDPEGLKKLQHSDDEEDLENNPRFKGVVVEKPVSLINKRASLPCDTKEIQPAEKKTTLIKSKTLPENDEPNIPAPIKPIKLKMAFTDESLNKTVIETKRDSSQFTPIRSRDSSATRSNNSIGSSQQSIPRKTPARYSKPVMPLRNRSASKSPVSHQNYGLNGPEAPQYIRTPTPSSSRATTPIEVQEEANEKVKTNLSNLTDISLFLFATYVYLFKHPLLALPILILLIQRQLGDFIKSKLPDFTGNRKS
jgi:hypothetical protein